VSRVKTMSIEENVIPQAYSVKHFFGASEPKLITQIGALRLSVWQNESHQPQGSAEADILVDEHEDCSHHWTVFSEQGELIAAARLGVYQELRSLPDGDWYDDLQSDLDVPIAYFSRCVVDQKHRCQGIGGFLIEDRLRHARELGAKCVLADLPEYRIAAFKQQGFHQIRPPKAGSVIPTLSWTVMVLRI